MSLSRRNLMLISSAALLGACATGTGLSNERARNNYDRFLTDIDRPPDAILPIWPADAPGLDDVDLQEHFVERTNAFGLPDRAANDVTSPTLSYFRSETYSGNAILLIPGGAYHHVVVEKEGWEGARYFNQFGYDVYVMTYRLPFQGWPAGPDVSLQDAQRAIRVLRSHSQETRGAPPEVASMGFSAGGHLAGSLAQRFAEPTYEPVDEKDELSARPDLSALIYPVVLMDSPHTHAGSRRYLLGEDHSDQERIRYDLSLNVNPESPPLFLLHALDDTSVLMENSMELMTAYRNQDIPAVLHIFEHGGHGFGMRGIDGTPLEDWPGLFMNWAGSHGLPPTNSQTYIRGTN